MSRAGWSSSAITSEASSRSTCVSERAAISRKRWRASVGCVKTRVARMLSRLRLQLVEFLAQRVRNRHLRPRFPVEKNDYDLSGSGKLPAIVLPDLGNEIHRGIPHLGNPDAHVDL